jgi:hypothetical protein
MKVPLSIILCERCIEAPLPKKQAEVATQHDEQTLEKLAAPVVCGIGSFRK